MSTHSYARCWLHLIWSTHNREKSLPKNARKSLAHYFSEYAKEKQIYLRANYVNADHVHALIDLPSDYTIADVVKLFKGSSSRWINEQGIVPGRFRWGRGYGAFSVSQSGVERTVQYIQNQEEHHRTKTSLEEFEEFLKGYELENTNR